MNDFLIFSGPITRLKELTLPRGLTNNELEISTEMLNQIKFISVQGSYFVDLMGNNLLAPALPSLTKLQVQRSYYKNNSPPHVLQYHRFLESLFAVANSLEDLNIEFIGEKPVNMVPFPEFQFLKQLQIRNFSWNWIPEFVNPMVFPGLISIDMYLHIFGVLQQQDEFDAGVTAEQMPKVNQVTLRLKSQNGQINPMSLESPLTNSNAFRTYFDYLTARFPNAHKLIVINESFDGKSFKPFLLGLKGSEGAKNFHELEFVDFDENYLSQIFEETIHPPRIILENLPRNPELEKMISQIFDQLVTTAGIETEENHRTIIQALPNQETPNQLINLKSFTMRLDWTGKSMCSNERVRHLTALGCTDEERKRLLVGIPNSLNLLSLARNLPTLEEIRISAFMFGYDKVIQAKEIQSVKSEYPDMKIVMI